MMTTIIPGIVIIVKIVAVICTAAVVGSENGDTAGSQEAKRAIWSVLVFLVCIIQLLRTFQPVVDSVFSVIGSVSQVISRKVLDLSYCDSLYCLLLLICCFVGVIGKDECSCCETLDSACEVGVQRWSFAISVQSN